LNQEQEIVWKSLENDCKKCTKCDLAKTRINVVFGQGNYYSKILFIGEGPGKNEDLQGKPFVGRSGELLDKLLAEINLYREKNFYITNIIKCRPPQNRNPLSSEQGLCINWLHDQIKTIKPKIIISLGRIAAMCIMNPKIKIKQDHGKFINKNNIWFMATFHPSALLRNTAKKSDIKGDFLVLKSKIKEFGIKI
jgi:DNA polymerase